MTTNTNSATNPRVNEVERDATPEDLDDGVIYKIELRPGENRLIIRVQREFTFSM